MTIKEVESLTGLTAKSIRLYEAKGLLTVRQDWITAKRAELSGDMPHNN